MWSATYDCCNSWSYSRSFDQSLRLKLSASWSVQIHAPVLRFHSGSEFHARTQKVFSEGSKPDSVFLSFLSYIQIMRERGS